LVQVESSPSPKQTAGDTGKETVMETSTIIASNYASALSAPAIAASGGSRASSAAQLRAFARWVVAYNSPEQLGDRIFRRTATVTIAALAEAALTLGTCSVSQSMLDAFDINNLVGIYGSLIAMAVVGVALLALDAVLITKLIRHALLRKASSVNAAAQPAASPAKQLGTLSVC